MATDGWEMHGDLLGHTHFVPASITSDPQYYYTYKDAASGNIKWTLNINDVDLVKMRELLLLLTNLIKPHIIDDNEGIVNMIEQLQLALGDYSVAPKVEGEKHLDNDLFEL